MQIRGEVILNSPRSTPPVSEPEVKEKVPKKQCSPALRWCFTWNNYPSNWQEIVQDVLISEYSIGEETAPTTGTKHLQGYIEFKTKQRPSALKWPKAIHWEVAKGDRKANVAYTQKEGSAFHSRQCRQERPLIVHAPDKPWQLELAAILTEHPDDRTIHWYWETQGKTGKSTFCKWLCAVHNAIICAGKAADMKHQIASATIKPEIVIFDVPRSNLQYISYTGIEEIKNGCFASSKYESAMVLMNSPHVVIFANEPPDFEKLSEDRWHVVNIK